MYVYHYLYVRINSLISLNSLISKAISEKHDWEMCNYTVHQSNFSDGFNASYIRVKRCTKEQRIEAFK